MSDLPRRQRLGGRRLQPPDQHDVFPTAQHLWANAGGQRERRPSRRAVFARGSQSAGSRHRPAGDGAGDLGGDGKDALDLSAAGGHDVARCDRGSLIFGGDVNGRFRAFDHDTAEVLWEINVGSSVSGFPITYAVNGRQYVAMSTGPSGNAQAFALLTPELRPSIGNNLFVFALPNQD